ncbi:tRNA pseudouridine(65) synthase TruC [Sulfurovum sp. TSL1]|uniref:tRNA pseudouridine(65) synthase TruC n=1 Tax=Sulfurovum sp. TSL1 TaxID=2826994 RepID=UPI001CC5B0E4|nr:tRNA pseudouridine(65) synthase TruC [Sulfurovum sp. TSL1]GIT99032.1 tRNA pseudouridine(65) synthase TruC [Sulfurovum sp. TSL1]
MDKTETNPLEILYQDAYLVAINKPSGLLVHKSPIDKHETEFALQMVRDQIGQYVYPIHRLDKPTSGVLLFALDAQTAQRMSLMFRGSQVHKEYMAVVRGFTEDASLIDYPLKQMLDTKEQKQKGITKETQEAQTQYQRLATVELPYPVSRYPVARYSLVKLFPRTGRKHQLRRHMKHIFHPIIGDTKHGRGEHNTLFREKYACHRLLLHSNRISFMHPIRRETLVIDAALDDTWQRIFKEFGWEQFIY